MKQLHMVKIVRALRPKAAAAGWGSVPDAADVPTASSSSSSSSVPSTPPQTAAAAAAAAAAGTPQRMGLPPLRLKPAETADSEFDEAVDVGAGSSRDVAIAMSTAGASVTWRWRVYGGDVIFSALFVPGAVNPAKIYRASRDVEVVEAWSEEDSAQGAQRLTANKSDFVAPEAGMLLLRFDNSYSWMTSKQIELRIKQEEHGSPPGGVIES